MRVRLSEGLWLGSRDMPSRRCFCRTASGRISKRFPYRSCSVAACTHGGFCGVSAAFPQAFPCVSWRFRPFPHRFQAFNAFTHILQRVRKLCKTHANLKIPVHGPPLHRRFRPQPNPPIIILKGFSHTSWAARADVAYDRA